MSNLYTASSQWANRPADERFANLPDMIERARYYRECAVEVDNVNFDDLRISIDNSDLCLDRGAGRTRLSNYAFGQLAARIGAPASYLRTMPTNMVEPLIRHGLETCDNRRPVNLLMHKNGGSATRALTSTRYSRIWNEDVLKSLVPLTEKGWRVPPARPAMPNQPGTRTATEADVLEASGFGLSVKVGDEIANAGLYLSAHDMFCFFVNENYRLDCGTEGGMSRGFFVRQSEVGDASLELTSFYYQHVCGNHIVWGAKDVKVSRIRHIGSANVDGIRRMEGELASFAFGSAEEENARLLDLRTREIAKTQEDVVDAIFTRTRNPHLTKRNLNAAYGIAETVGANPRTPWGIVDGLTRLSQNQAYGDTRNDMDRAAGSILSLNFN